MCWVVVQLCKSLLVDEAFLHMGRVERKPCAWMFVKCSGLRLRLQHARVVISCPAICHAFPAICHTALQYAMPALQYAMPAQQHAMPALQYAILKAKSHPRDSACDLLQIACKSSEAVPCPSVQQPGHGSVVKRLRLKPSWECEWARLRGRLLGPFPSWNRDFGVTKGSGDIGLSWDIRLSPDIRLFGDIRLSWDIRL